MHPLLERQLRRCFGDKLPQADELERFLRAVDDAYASADSDRALIERSLDLMSAELTERNADLRAQLEEKQRAEQQLEGLLSLLGTTLESTADGILAMDKNGHIMRFNERFALMWRIPDDILAFWRHDQVMAHILGQVTAPDEFMNGQRALIESPDMECCDIINCSDGRVFERYVRPQPLGLSGVGRVLSFRDITERVRIEREQEALLKQLQEAHTQLLHAEKMAAIGQLSAGVAHEINNPIGFVSSNLATLQEYAGGMLELITAYGEVERHLVPYPDVLSHLDDVKQAVALDYLREDIPSLIKESRDGVARVKQIVQDLKDFSRPDQSGWQWTDLHAGLDSTLNIVRNEIKHKAEVVREYGELPRVECIASQINQVFMNILVNAGHAIEGEGVIRVRTGSEGGEWAWIEISDNGGGIAPEHMTHLFEPFFTTKPVGKGTGLGLSISHGIISKHGGRMEVESRLGKGTVFRIWLPVSKQMVNAASSAQA